MNLTIMMLFHPFATPPVARASADAPGEHDEHGEDDDGEDDNGEQTVPDRSAPRPLEPRPATPDANPIDPRVTTPVH